MEVGKGVLQQILQSDYVIPVFQRYYTWDKADWEQLWQDLMELKEDADEWHHFMGSLVFVAQKQVPGRLTSFQVVDGQQRLLTLTLLLAALRDFVRDAGFESLVLDIEDEALIRPRKQGQERYRVYPRQRDREDFLAAVDGTANIAGKIGQAVIFFLQQIADMPGSDTEASLRELFATIQGRLDFVHITIDGENPYRIFQSLNSTGVDLSEADLIRNYVLMHVATEEQETFDDVHWTPLENQFLDAKGEVDTRVLSSFFRDFLARAGSYIREGNTFITFEQRYPGPQLDTFKLALELLEFADFYDIARGHKPFGNPAVGVALRKLQALDSSTTYPLLLTLLHANRIGDIADGELAEAIEDLAGFILRRLVCGLTSRSYGRWFVAASLEFTQGGLGQLQGFLVSKDWPNDELFRTGMAEFNLYGSRYAPAILGEVERSYGHKETVSLATLTVEHVMPQTLTPAWRAALGSDAESVHTRFLNVLGNLTLTGYNSEMGNRPFVEKRVELAASKLVMNREIAESDHWNADTITGRSRDLVQRACTIWRGPPAILMSAGIGDAVNSEGLTPTRATRLLYWSDFSRYLLEHNSFLPRSEPPSDQSLYFCTADPGVRFFAWQAGGRWRALAAGIELTGPEHKRRFGLLHERRRSIESDFGTELTWQEQRGVKESVIQLQMEGANPADRSTWAGQFSWLMQQLELLYIVFSSAPELSGLGVTPPTATAACIATTAPVAADRGGATNVTP